MQQQKRGLYCADPRKLDDDKLRGMRHRTPDLAMAIIVPIKSNPFTTAEWIAEHNDIPLEDVNMYIAEYLEVGILEERP